MKNATFMMMFGLGLSLLVSTNALAGGRQAIHIAKKQAAQQKRIQQGIQKGSLTPAEARTLKREQRKIRKTKQRFLADGLLNKRERRKLKTLQSQADSHIRRLKRNRAVRVPRGGVKLRQAAVHRRMATGQSAVRWV